MLTNKFIDQIKSKLKNNCLKKFGEDDGITSYLQIIKESLVSKNDILAPFYDINHLQLIMLNAFVKSIQ